MRRVRVSVRIRVKVRVTVTVRVLIPGLSVPVQRVRVRVRVRVRGADTRYWCARRGGSSRVLELGLMHGRRAWSALGLGLWLGWG